MKQNGRSYVVLFAALMSVLLMGGARMGLAQMPTSTILGTVMDQTGAVVPDVTVTATSTETGVSRVTRAGTNGTYRFSALPVGSYTVQAEKPGFQTVIQSGLRITIGQEAVINFRLQVGTVAESISVTAEAPIVNTTSGTLSSLVSEQTVSDLPLNGRNFNDLTLLQTGISVARTVGKSGTIDGAQFSSGGAPIRSNTYMLDGTIMNNVTSSGGGSSVNENSLGVEAIREYRVLTNSYSAEYGNTMGAQISLATKSGTNQFHGSLFEYLRNSAMDARNWTDIPEKAPLRRNSFGGSLGGPIMQDRLFFFVTYEGLRQREGATLAAVVPTAAARQDGGLVPVVSPVVKPYLDLFPLPNGPDLGQGLGQFFAGVSRVADEDYGMVRGDYTISNADSLFGRWTINDPRNVDPAYDDVIPPNHVQALGRNQYVTVSENHIFSPTLLNTFRFSFARTANSSPRFGPDAPGLNFVEGQPMGGLGISGVSEVAPNRPVLDASLDRYSFGDDVFFTFGRHSLKFGTLIHNTRNFVDVTTNKLGQWQFASLSNFLEARAETFTVITPGSRNDRTYDFSILGFYAQDDIQVRPGFTLNLGLRYEFHTEYEEVNGLGFAVRDLINDTEATPGAPFENASLRNFSPRFGFAWDVRGDGKTAVRGGFGLLYDLATVGSAFIVGATSTPPISTTTRLTRPEFRPLPPIPTGRGSRTLRTMDYHLQQPHLLSYNLTVDRELPAGLGLTLTYGGSRGINLIQSRDGNPTVPFGVVRDGICDSRVATPPASNTGPKCWRGAVSATDPVVGGARGIDPRINPAWADVEFKTAGGSSWYNSLQFQLTKSLSHGVQFQSSYTYSKLIDDTQGQFQGSEGLGAIQDDPSNRFHERGRAEFDIRHQWRLNGLYRFPSPFTGIAGTLGNGWWTGAIFSWNSGVPFVPQLGTQRSRSLVLGANGGDKRPHLVAGFDAEDITRGTSNGCAGVPGGTKLGTPERFFDPCAFAIQPIGFLGNAGRGIISGPNFSTLDFSLAKDTPLPFLGETGALQFRAEFFNILNHPSFGLPQRVVYTGASDVEPARSTAGQITSTFSEAREVQLALKIIF